MHSRSNSETPKRDSAVLSIADIPKKGSQKQISIVLHPPIVEEPVKPLPTETPAVTASDVIVQRVNTDAPNPEPAARDDEESELTVL